MCHDKNPPPKSATQSSLHHRLGMHRTSNRPPTHEQTSFVHDLINILLAVSNALSAMSFDFTRDDIWDLVVTNSTICSPPSLPALRRQDVAIQAGSFNRDLPPSKCAVRKLGKLAKKKKGSHQKNIHRLSQERKQGSAAFVCPRLNAAKGEVEWFWSDCKGKGTQADALSHHDQVVTKRARQHNRNLAIYWAKCRIMRYLEPASSDWRCATCTLDPSLLQEAPCLWPRVLKSSQTDDALKALAPRHIAAQCAR
ncbi:hypothetical protein CDD81_2351 [Ophiocordyceps australis]|uniref:Uncharacterized protein n=1 Tax=Ophiocordyceps australis TaxID=1399860 RepID=A0A2C5XYC7_9HYPO|nr:hypothetical protein CDD81_2351 [Ophiocordyceps australis]